MRIWDVPVSRLCRQHLLGEHHELHCIWSIYVNGRRGYTQHPEVKRWSQHLRALAGRHAAQVREFTRRGYQHKSPLREHVQDSIRWPASWQSRAKQKQLIRQKGCACRV